MKSFGPKNFQIPCTDQKVPFWQFFRQGPDGHAVHCYCGPRESLTGFQKFFFALVADEFLAMLEGKIREAPFF